MREIVHLQVGQCGKLNSINFALICAKARKTRVNCRNSGKSQLKRGVIVSSRQHCNLFDIFCTSRQPDWIKSEFFANFHEFFPEGSGMKFYSNGDLGRNIVKKIKENHRTGRNFLKQKML